MSDIFPVLPCWTSIIEIFEDKSKKYWNINKYKSKKYSNISTFRRNSFTCARSKLVDSCLVLPTPAWSTTTEGWYRWNVDELDDRDKMMMLMNMPAYSGLIYGCQVYQMLIYRGQAYQMIIFGGQVYQMSMLGRFIKCLCWAGLPDDDKLWEVCRVQWGSPRMEGPEGREGCRTGQVTFCHLLT